MPGDEARTGTSQVMMPVFMGAPWAQKFGGVGSDLKFRDWKQQLETMLSLQALNEQQKAAFVLSNLEGEARREILTLDLKDRDTSIKIFAALARIYGETTSVAALRTQFFNCRQESGQSLKSFSLHLRELFSRLKERRDGLANEDSVLRDQFIMGLKDDHVRRELKQQVRRNPDLSFEDVWKESLSLEEEQNDVWPATSCLAVSKHSDTSSDWKQTFKAEILKEVREQMTVMTKTLLEELKNEQAPPFRASHRERAYSDGAWRRPSRLPPRSQTPPPHARYQWDAQGKPICNQCGESGHISRHCPPKDGQQGF